MVGACVWAHLGDGEIIPVENGDRVRVTNLEIKTGNLVSEVATLGGELHTHMDQVAADKIEAKRENSMRHRDVTSRIDATLEVARNNATKLSTLVAIDTDRQKRNPGMPVTVFPAMNGKTKLAAGGVLGLGGVMIVIEGAARFYAWVQSVLP